MASRKGGAPMAGAPREKGLMAQTGGGIRP